MIEIRVVGRAVLLAAVGLWIAACGGERGAEGRPAEVVGAAPGREDPIPATDSLTSRVTLTAAAAAEAGIKTDSARGADPAVEGGLTEVPGQVVADPNRIALISPRGSGRLERLTAVVGDRVAAGQVVAWVMSPEFLTAQADFRQASRRAALLAASPDSTGARALAAAARGRLKLFGIPDAELDALERGGEPSGLLPVSAPFSGSLVESMTMAGASVQAGSPIFRLIDLREVDIAANVPEPLLPGLRIGQRAAATLPAYPDSRFEGRIERIKDELDPSTRTVEALIHVANPGGVLRPGMFAQVQLQIRPPFQAGSEATVAVVVPASAIISDGARRYLFVEVAPLTFERRGITLGGSEVRFGALGTGVVFVQGDVRAGERVVTAGAFTLKSELAKAGFAEEE